MKSPSKILTILRLVFGFICIGIISLPYVLWKNIFVRKLRLTDAEVDSIQKLREGDSVVVNGLSRKIDHVIIITQPPHRITIDCEDCFIVITKQNNAWIAALRKISAMPFGLQRATFSKPVDLVSLKA